MRYILFILITFFACCNTSKVNNPADFYSSYTSKSGLMNFEMKIEVTDGSLKLNYRNGQNQKSGNAVYTLKDEEIAELSKYLDKIGFLTMKSPEPEKILDAPQQTIEASYNSKSNKIDFGSVKTPPESLVTYKKMLFDLTDKYNKTWKKDMMLE
jgi:hypothetical protein